MHELVGFQRAQGAVQPARIVAAEPKRPQLLEQLIAVRGTLAQQQQQAGAQEVLRQDLRRRWCLVGRDDRSRVWRGGRRQPLPIGS